MVPSILWSLIFFSNSLFFEWTFLEFQNQYGVSCGEDDSVLFVDDESEQVEDELQLENSDEEPLLDSEKVPF